MMRNLSWVRRAAAALVTVSLVLVLVPFTAASAVGEGVSAFAGGPGEGPARGIGQQPSRLAIRGSAVFVADSGHDVVRRIDLSSGHETVVAGIGIRGSTGDGGDPLHARLAGPSGVEVAADGTIYIAEALGHRVRRISPDGVITTVAGTGTEGFSGDGGNAVEAALSSPGGLALDGAGALLIADTGNNRIRKVTPAGTITTYAGAVTGSNYPIGDGGPATSALLNHPTDVSIDTSGGLLIADFLHDRIRRVSTDGTITTVAGQGGAAFSGDGGPATSASLYLPRGVEATADGGFLIADTSNRRVRKVTSDGTITTVAGGGSGYTSSGDGGPATAAVIERPTAVAVTGDGEILIADPGDHRIRYVSGSTINTLAGTGFLGDRGGATAGNVEMGEVAQLAGDGAGGLLFADRADRRVRRLPKEAGVSTVAGGEPSTSLGDGGPATAAMLMAPHGVVRAPNGDVYVSEFYGYRIRKVSGGIITTVAGTGDFGYSGDGGPATSAAFTYLLELGLGPDGALYVVDAGNKRVRRIAGGVVTTVVGGGTSDAEGAPATSYRLGSPSGIAFDKAGRLLVSDSGANRIIRVLVDGTIQFVAGDGTRGNAGDGGSALQARLHFPTSMVVGGDGTIYFTDAGNHRIRRVSPGGLISTVAGSTEGYAGDGGPVLNARFSSPAGLLLIDQTHLVVGDLGNRRLRMIDLAEVPPSPATTTTTSTSPITTTVPKSAPPTTVVPRSDDGGGPSPAKSGYWMVTGRGEVFGFGDAGWYGNAPSGSVDAVDIERAPLGDGYWVVDAAGRVFSFGSAAYHGGGPALAAGERVTSMSSAAAGAGYWLFTDQGRVISYGAAIHRGDMAGVRLNGAVLDSIPTPTGGGYYMVAADGGIFTFGDAVFQGSMGNTRLNAPVQSLVPDGDGTGYWLVASDGGIFAFEAPFRGSMGDVRLNRPVTGMVGYKDGYMMVAEDGGIFTFGDARFHGSLGASPPVSAVVSVAAIGS